MDIDALIVLLLAAQFKIGLVAFWRLSKRLTDLQRKNLALSKAVHGLHKEEFAELRDGLHRINVSMLESESRSLGMDLVENEATKINEDLWIKDKE